MVVKGNIDGEKFQGYCMHGWCMVKFVYERKVGWMEDSRGD